MKRKSRFLLCALALVVGCAPGGGADSAEGRIDQNETMAVSHLRSLVGAQTHAQSLCIIDQDGDNVGEFLLITELSGLRPVRAGGAGMKSPLLDPEVWRLSTGGFIEMHGYLFGVFLTGEGGGPLSEAAEIGAAVDSNATEKEWVAYAWPVQYGESGKRTFAVNQSGEVVAKDVPANSGTNAPEPRSAYTHDGKPGKGFTVVE
jgi:hypothetical protein